jgi:hypothetical protein
MLPRRLTSLIRSTALMWFSRATDATVRAAVSARQQDMNRVQRAAHRGRNRSHSRLLAAVRFKREVTMSRQLFVRGVLIAILGLSMRSFQAVMSADLHGRNPSAWLRFQTEVKLSRGSQYGAYTPKPDVKGSRTFREVREKRRGSHTMCRCAVCSVC